MTSTPSQAAIGIGELASRTHCKPETVRYYEKIGLLPAAPRNEGNQRRYSEATVQRLMFIRHARDFGFSVEAVRELLDMADHPSQPCDQVDQLARRHLAEVESRIQRLMVLRDELKRTVAQCDGDSVAQCRIIEVLSDHRLCSHDAAHGGAEALR
ncbi:MerR family transcriptional regulator [Halomonas sp. G11]|jgi:DNA-binding transcriptional MerR regulator|uniref:MerR family transcriptional regulator n=1 Tax=Halomonas sp. G11 TaxID=1684425 RepID=UPI0007FE5EEF|nr:helix-turn-helix domain-containing protein [Halomonas sp. G11]OAZ89368.1 MerR family transcriptional regulator [Halomonas sp. G11]